MTSASVGGVGTSFTNDPMMRLYQTSSGGAVQRFAFDGLNALSEHDGADALQRRWVYDPTTGQPVVQYEGTGVAAADRRYMAQDERGSVISMSDSNGASLGINTYDEYGNPSTSSGGGTLTGRYGFTGQAWIPSAQLWYLNARMYSSAIGGRFMQPDPIGYAGGINLYAYVLNDPVNAIDPLGLGGDEGINVPPCPEKTHCETVTWTPPPLPNLGRMQLSLISFTGPGDFTYRGPASRRSSQKIVVTARRRTMSVCEMQFAGSLFSELGLSFDLGSVLFRSGLDRNANRLTRAAFADPNNWAVTQYNTIYVQPERWGAVTDPRGTIFWEEIAHTAQFSTYGSVFYMSYGAGALYSRVKSGDWYHQIPLEVRAKDWALDLSQAFRAAPCAG